MSAEKQIAVTCDDCGREETFPGTNIRGARAQARKLGWRTGMKSRPDKVALYDTKRDVCGHCRECA